MDHWLTFNFTRLGPKLTWYQATQNTIKIGVSAAATHLWWQEHQNFSHQICPTVRKKKTPRVQGGLWADMPLFWAPFPFIFFVFLCVCVSVVFFFSFFLILFFFCFLVSSSSSSSFFFLLLVLVFHLVLLVFVVLFFSFSSYLGFFFFVFFFFFFFFLFFIFICLIFLFLFILLLFFLFLLINQKDRQKRQTGLIIDGKHSNILVFSCTSREAKEKTVLLKHLFIFTKKT